MGDRRNFCLKKTTVTLSLMTTYRVSLISTGSISLDSIFKDTILISTSIINKLSVFPFLSGNPKINPALRQTGFQNDGLAKPWAMSNIETAFLQLRTKLIFFLDQQSLCFSFLPVCLKIFDKPCTLLTGFQNDGLGCTSNFRLLYRRVFFHIRPSGAFSCVLPPPPTNVLLYKYVPTRR